jgi:secondary thiamine-phosphate synthase enzyme
VSVHSSIVKLDTDSRTHWIDITHSVKKIVLQSGINNGLVTITSLHTTAAITINENADPDVEHDFFLKLNKMVPFNESGYLHAEGNSDSHVKTSLVGLSTQRTLSDGEMLLGIWQSIYFCEFDGPRNNRSFSVTIIGE